MRKSYKNKYHNTIKDVICNTFCNQMCASAEGFFAGILYKPDDPRRFRAFASCYAYAQKMIREGSQEFAYWNDKVYIYGSNFP